MTILYQKFISRDDLRRNPRVLYVFGDNDERAGLGGQAREMRGEPNAVGIRTKAAPHNRPDAFWSDATYEENWKKIADDFHRVRDHLHQDGIVVYPSDGIGTGLAQMAIRCPKTFQYLDRIIRGFLYD